MSPFAGACQALRLRLGEASDERRRRVEELCWMVEELRVSVFAQELGTAQRVSPARLERQLEEVAKAD